MRTILLPALIVAAVLAAAGTIAPAPTFAGPDCGADASIDGEEREMLRLINAHRDDHGLPPLSLSNTLSKAASWKSANMADEDYFAHNDTPIDRTWSQRLRDCGYTLNAWLGENIAAGNATAAATFRQWRESPGHNANMLSENFTVIGIGRAYDADSRYGWYWTTDFGGVSDGGAPPPASFPDNVGDTSCDGRINSIDAALVLQLSARLATSLPCPVQADVNGDGAIDALDAAMILQYSAGFFV